MDNYWALILGNGFLIAVAVAGGVGTLVRSRTVGRSATALSLAACVLLLVMAVADCVFWLAIAPSAVTAGDDRATTVFNLNAILFALGIAGAVALSVLATNAGRRPVAAPTVPYPAPAPTVGYPMAQPPTDLPGAGGWTPPQQAQSSEWNVMSGVWSIPPGTFDGPPPNHRR